MPWSDVDDQTAADLAEASGTHYILFFASGKPPWCVDCRDAQPYIHDVFGSTGPRLNVVRVGEREQWKSDDNPYKHSICRVLEIPTLVKLVDGEEVRRIGEAGCKSDIELKLLLQAQRETY